MFIQAKKKSHTVADYSETQLVQNMLTVVICFQVKGRIYICIENIGVASPWSISLSRVAWICCGITKTILYLARSLLFYSQNPPLVQPHPAGPSWAAQRRRLPVPHVPPSWRLPVPGPPSTSGYPRDATCPATLLCVQSHVPHVSSATRSVAM